MPRRLLHGLAIGGAAAALALLMDFAGLGLDSAERLTWDWRVRQFAHASDATDQIRLVLLDQSSLDWAEEQFSVPWKWPRQFYVPVLDYLQQAGAKAVAFDMIFTEGSDAADPTDDAQFAASISRGVPFVVALSLSDEQGLTTNWPSQLPAPPDLTSTAVTPDPRLHQLARCSPPIAEVGTAATTVGNVFAMPDSDGSYRRINPLVLFDQRPVPALGLALYLAGSPRTTLALSEDGLHVDETLIPLDRHGQAILRYRGKSQTHQAVNVAAVIESQMLSQAGQPPLIPPDFFRDRYVLFGVSAPALHDMKPTPVSGSYPGVEIHATLLDNLLANDFPRQASVLPRLLLILAFALVAGLAARTSVHSWQPIALLLLAPAAATAVGIAGYKLDYWLPIATPAAAALLAVIGGVIVNYAMEGRQKRFIKHAFKQYLSPDVIDALVANPTALTLGGEARELTIFFSDLQGFTSIAEHLDPQSLTALLNDYLTAMTDIILASGGTIDKYEGDAIIAFWNAPLAQADHAQRGVQAAMDCQAKLDELRPQLQAQYGADLHVRIGLNTGTVVVGNLGSTRRFDYTFLGDAGNLASRLEGINKQFGSGILLSAATAAQLAPASAIVLREISRVQVVGRREPVTVYEPCVLPHHAEPSFGSALDAYYHGQFDKAHGLFATLTETDPVAAHYAVRCDQLRHAPPESWNGVWVMDQK